MKISRRRLLISLWKWVRRKHGETLCCLWKQPGAHATIAPKEGASVPVGLWTIQSRDESRLDMYEGYRKTGYRYYDKEQVRVNMTNGGSVIGMVYIMDQKMDFGQPTPGYYDTVREGYANCGLDETVLEQALNSSLELAQARMAEEPQHPW